MYEKKTHGEWLSLLEISGPFLAETVLESHFPQGLDELEPTKKRLLRQAYEEWREAQDNADPIFNELHKAWIDVVLKQGLELDEDNDAEVLKPASAIDGFTFDVPEHGITIRPDYLVVTGNNHPPSLLIQTLPANTNPDAASRSDGWATSPAERLVQLCRATKVRLGLITDGERWMLIDAPEGGVTTYASWYARLWGQEPVTLQAFINLLGIRRFFLHKSQQLPALLDESLKHQDEVTDALGDQVKRAVEVLIQALDKADQDRERELLKDVEPAELYEAGLTVMMRLVFLLSAEERGLLLLGDERYEAYYAVSSLRMQLREQAGLHSEEILSHRRDAWSRLLAIFRAVYGGVDHDALRMPALGGSLFDPDRFPFLEGRAKGSTWLHESAQPLPIDNRTVLLLLDAIQLFQGRTLSYRALDVEQIGYVYEGLLERTVVRAKEVTLELNATKKSKKPWVTWGELEDARLSGEKAVMALLESRTESSASRIKNDLNKTVSEAEKEKLLVVCQGDQALRDRLIPYFHFLRIDPWGYPLIYPKGAFMVATGTDRRETGTHYTPKSLTESIVRETLEPVVYVGPAEDTQRQDWKLKSPAEILDLKICDLAMGSGAFLVQVCRWLSERLLEAWTQAESQGKCITNEGVVVDKIASHEPLIANVEERLVAARRLISERCLYGVDINPLAVELAKLSIWLVTLAKGRPFGFLDHNLRQGDSLLGITDLEQLYYLNMNVGKGSEKKLFSQKIDEAVKEAVELRMELRARPILDIHDVEVMSHLDKQARRKLEFPELVADALIGETLNPRGRQKSTVLLSIETGKVFEGDVGAFESLKMRARIGLDVDLPEGKKNRNPFHWCLEFPEVFGGESPGFDAIVGNPPFLGGQKITGAMGDAYRDYLVENIAAGKRGSADLVAYFFIRANTITHKKGHFGLIAVNTISEGNTREIGLDSLIGSGSIIYKAIPNIVWSGEANVVTSSVHLSKSEWLGDKFIGESKVSYISSSLTQRNNWKPVTLSESSGLVFQGAITLGDGFIVDDKTYSEWKQSGDNSCDVVFDYLIGKEVNQSPIHKPGRKVINFYDWSEERAKVYTKAYKYILESVKPDRENGNDKGAREYWWRYLRPRPELFHLIGRGHNFEKHPKSWNENFQPLSKVIVFVTQATKFPCFTFVENSYIYAHSLCVVASQSMALFSCLSSDIHTIWAWEHGSRMKQDLRYTHGDVFETFPFPNGTLSDTQADLRRIGELFFKTRQRYMQENKKGMTKFYNDLHDPDIGTKEIYELRDIQVQLNDMVLSAYGFDDIKIEQGFHEVAYLPEGKNMRFTISEIAREELLYRLAMLNKERHESEISNNSNPGSSAFSKQDKKRIQRDPRVDITEKVRPQMDFFGQED